MCNEKFTKSLTETKICENIETIEISLHEWFCNYDNIKGDVWR